MPCRHGEKGSGLVVAKQGSRRHVERNSRWGVAGIFIKVCKTADHDWNLEVIIKRRVEAQKRGRVEEELKSGREEEWNQ